MARSIREDIVHDRKKHMERISIRDNENPQYPDGSNMKSHLAPIPNVFEVERKYN